MRKNIYITIILGVFLLWAMLTAWGCSTKKQVLAKVGDRVITVSEFNDRIARLPVQYQELIKKEKDKFLDDFIIELLFCNEALNLGLDKNKDVKEVLKEAKRKILMAKFIEEEIEKKVTVKEEEARDYYEKNKDNFMMPETLRASHILLKTEEKAKEVLDKLGAGADFAKLAEEESIDITNKRGGDVGYFRKGQLIPEFEEACFRLETGQISQIVKTSFGYHIIKLTDRKPAQARSFEDIKDEIKAMLTSAKRKERFNQIIRKLKENTAIEINQEMLKNE